jgi:TRAP-type C4-dicarboxylate transport system permease large subunit
MTRDPFLRLALIAACSLYAGGIVVFGIYFGALRAVGVFVLGVLFALALTTVIEGDAPSVDLRRRQRQPAEGTRGFERVG